LAGHGLAWHRCFPSPKVRGRPRQRRNDGLLDAAAFGLVERRSQHLAFGEFSAKFAAAVAGAPHLEPPDIIEAEPARPRTKAIPISTSTP